jgi:hypothetical protein
MLYKFLLLPFLYSAFALPRPPLPCKNVVRYVPPVSLLPPQAILAIFGSDLEGIITARAFISSLLTNLRNEFTGDRLFLQFYYPNSDSLMYLSISLIFVYGQWKFYEGSQSIEKFQKIKSFNRKETFLKNLIFIILFVFTKDVMSAT